MRAASREQAAGREVDAELFACAASRAFRPHSHTCNRFNTLTHTLHTSTQKKSLREEHHIQHARSRGLIHPHVDCQT